jgi:hypothetical protein
MQTTREAAPASARESMERASRSLDLLTLSDLLQMPDFVAMLRDYYHSRTCPSVVLPPPAFDLLAYCRRSRATGRPVHQGLRLWRRADVEVLLERHRRAATPARVTAPLRAA